MVKPFWSRTASALSLARYLLLGTILPLCSHGPGTALGEASPPLALFQPCWYTDRHQKHGSPTSACSFVYMNIICDVGYNTLSPDASNRENISSEHLYIKRAEARARPWPSFCSRTLDCMLRKVKSEREMVWGYPSVRMPR